MDIFKSELVACQPIDSLLGLLEWSQSSNDARRYRIRKLNQNNHSTPAAINKGVRKMIVCHDMRNNYLFDKYFQGSNNSNDFSFYHWNLIDTFIYFSHHFITVPPESWTNAAHENGVRMLGTFITEWKEGAEICQAFLKDESTIDKCVQKLVELTLHYGFDGWLINIENPVESTSSLVYFVKRLTDSLKAIDPELYQVIWYDSVIESGELKWQNELNKLNEPFFNVCDGIFVNYTWKCENLENCIRNYSSRLSDIYIGVDVFGRGCMGDGGFNTHIAIEKIHEYNLSCALFAPGWLLEANNEQELIKNSQLFWNLLEKYSVKRQLVSLPISTTFSHSRGEKFFLYGKQCSTTTNWCNLNVQSLLPAVFNPDRSIEWCFTDAFYAGSCIMFKSQQCQLNLFNMNVNVNENKCLKLEYSYKIESDLEASFNYYKNTDRFLICLNYSIVDRDNREACFCFDSLKSTDQIEIIDCTQKTNRVGWHLRTLYLTVKQPIILTGLSAVNNPSEAGDNSIGKLGFLRIYEPDESSKQIVEPCNEATCSHKQIKVFKLQNTLYLCAHLTWAGFEEATTKYFNLFISENLSLAEPDLNESLTQTQQYRYIGSTTLPTYRLCLQMNANMVYEHTKPANGNQFSFDVYVQVVDSNLDNLVCSGFSANTSVLMGKSILKINIPLDKFHVADAANLSYIQQIVYDLENF